MSHAAMPAFVATGASGAGPVRAPQPVRPVERVTRETERALPARSSRQSGPAAVLQLSEQALALARGSEASGFEASSEAAKTDESEGTASNAAAAGTPGEVTPEQSREIQELKRRDREVRTHEQAHKAAGGAHAGSIHLEHTVGPDGKRYASSGEVSIDVSEVSGDPEATLRKMATVQRAANAPAEPSGADRQVAAQAAASASRARAEMAAERYAESQRFGESRRAAAAGRDPDQSTRARNA